MANERPTTTPMVSEATRVEQESEAQPQLEPKLEPLLPTGERRILVGTASWTDPTLIKCGRFYPKGCSSAEDRLRYYASRFPLVEVNSSYYALPSATNSQLWVERTPFDFVFNMRPSACSRGTRHPSKPCR